MTREVHPLSCADRRPTCLGQAGRVESGSWGTGEERRRDREKQWAIVGPRWLYDFQRVGAAGSETAAKGCREREKDGVGWDITGCGGM